MTDTTTKPFNLQDYINSGVRSGLFTGGGIGFSQDKTTTFAYSNSFLPNSKTPFSENTLFDIASITKAVVAIVILKLIEKGTLRLNTVVKPYVGATGEGWDKVTIQHLMTNCVDFDIHEKLHEHTPEELDLIILTSRVRNIDNGHYYRNAHTIILGWLLENLLQQPLEKIVRKEVFEPAGMQQTFFSTELTDSLLPHVHPSYNPLINREIIIGQPHDETAYQFAMKKQNPGCAGIFSTVTDMVKFGNYVLYDAFSDSETILEWMTKNYLEKFGRTSGLVFDNPKPDYVCPCFARNTLVMTGYTGCALWIHTKHQKVLTILTNITYPPSTKPRKQGEVGLVSPLFEYRQTLVRNHFYCKHCME